jgi:hypothetical protein
MRASPLALLLTAAVLFPPPAAAQTATAPTNTAPTATGETGLFTVIGPDALARRAWSFGLYYNNRDRVIDLDDEAFGEMSDPEIDWNRLSAAFGYGLTGQWELSVAFPFDEYSFRQDEGVFDERFDASGPNNLRVGVKYRVWEHAASATRLGVDGSVELPTGDRDEVAREGVGFGVLLTGQTRSLVYNVGYRDPGNEENVNSPQQLIAAGGYAWRVASRLDWLTEIVATFMAGGDPTPTPIQNAFDITTGARIWFQSERPWSVNAALRLNIDGLSGLGGIVGVTFGR